MPDATDPTPRHVTQMLYGPYDGVISLPEIARAIDDVRAQEATGKLRNPRVVIAGTVIDYGDDCVATMMIVAEVRETDQAARLRAMRAELLANPEQRALLRDALRDA